MWVHRAGSWGGSLLRGSLPLLTISSRVRDLFLFSFSLQRQLDQTGDQVAILHSRSPPQLGVHADRSESRHGVDVVQVEPALLARFEKKVHPRQSGAVAGAESVERHGLHLLALLFCKLGGNDGHRAFAQIFGFVIVKLLARDNLPHHRGLWLIVAQHRDFQLARLTHFCAIATGAHCLLDYDFAIETRSEVDRRSKLLTVMSLADTD